MDEGERKKEKWMNLVGGMDIECEKGNVFESTPLNVMMLCC